MRSMTGFGQASGENGRHAVTVTLRGVNHRFLDLRLKLGDDLHGSESALRELLQHRLHRGRVEAAVDVQSVEERRARVEVHRGVVAAAHQALHDLLEEGLIDRELTGGDLLRLPDAISVHLEADVWDEDDHRHLIEIAGAALDQLTAARSDEGARLARILGERLGSLEGVVGELERRREAAQGENAAALRERLERLLRDHDPDVSLDKGRLAQEIAVLAERSDVSEELDRLGAHLAHFREIARREGAVGKRLDFLIQEIFRELNTLGSKVRHAEMTRSVLDAKELAEQLREQVQNVE